MHVQESHPIAAFVHSFSLEQSVQRILLSFFKYALISTIPAYCGTFILAYISSPDLTSRLQLEQYNLRLNNSLPPYVTNWPLYGIQGANIYAANAPVSGLGIK